MADDKIEFFAQAGKWVVVKKLKVEPNTEPMWIARFLISVHETMDRKIWGFMAKDFDLEALDAIAGELCGAEKGKKGWKLKGRLSEDRMNEILAKLKSVSVSKQINNVVPTKKGRVIAKSYVTRKTIDIMGFPLYPDTKDIEKYLNEKALQD